MDNKIKTIKQKIMDRFDLIESQASNNLVFFEHGNKILVGMFLYNYASSEQNYYLYDGDKLDEFTAGLIAQIKCLPENKPTMFIRRLEFADNSYKGKGYASALIQCFEHYCAKNGFTTITGEFIPLHNEPEQKVAAYYRKNGYDIIKDQQGQNHIYKKIKIYKPNAVSGCDFIASTKIENEQTM